MPIFAFWNFKQNEEVDVLCDLIQRYGIEILVLAEQGFDSSKLIANYAKQTGTALFSIGLGHEIARVSVFSRFPTEQFVDVTDTPYVSIKEYRPIVGYSLLIVAVHLPSKLRQDSKDFPFIASRLRQWVEAAEQKVGHDRTILVGDFNMNPFEDGMVSSDAIHGVMDRRIAAKGSRKVLSEERRYFYNPMWKLMGDHRNQMLGTYFLSSGNMVHYFWDTFDQVLIRPSLLDFFREDDLSVLHEIGQRSLLAGTHPGINTSISDHLPLVFQISS